MISKSKLILLLPILLMNFISAPAYSGHKDDIFSHSFYAGLTGGYGSTTWAGLVPTQNNQVSAMLISTPTSINEGGVVWGAYGGYEFNPCFALQGSYLHYPDANVTFSSKSLYSFQHNGNTTFTTHTDVFALEAKIMLLIPHTNFRVYSSLGPAGIHRKDALNNVWRLSPNFGAGINYNFTPHIMGELGASYTAGYGETELSPAQDYLPFLYSVFLRLAYRF